MTFFPPAPRRPSAIRFRYAADASARRCRPRGLLEVLLLRSPPLHPAGGLPARLQAVGKARLRAGPAAQVEGLLAPPAFSGSMRLQAAPANRPPLLPPDFVQKIPSGSVVRGDLVPSEGPELASKQLARPFVRPIRYRPAYLLPSPRWRALTPPKGGVLNRRSQAVRFSPHNAGDELVEGHDARRSFAVPIDLGFPAIPRREVSPCSQALVRALHRQRLPRSGRCASVAPLTRLNAFFLLGGEYAIRRGQPPAAPTTFVKVQNARCLLLEVRIAGENPASMGPEAYCILAGPSPKSGLADRGDKPAPNSGVSRVRSLRSPAAPPLTRPAALQGFGVRGRWAHGCLRRGLLAPDGLWMRLFSMSVTG